MSAMILGGCGQTTTSNDTSVSTEAEADVEATADEELHVEENDSTTYQNTTISGRVTKIEGNQITLQLMNTMNGKDGAQRPEELPEGMEEGQTPPEMPEGEMGEMQTTKEIGENPRVIPEGEVLDGKMPENMENGQTPPELPEGTEASEAQEGTIIEPFDGSSEGDRAFKDKDFEGKGGKDNTVVFTIEDESLISLDEISEGDFISITFDEDGNMTEVSKMENPMQEGAPVEKREDEVDG